MSNNLSPGQKSSVIVSPFTGNSSFYLFICGFIRNKVEKHWNICIRKNYDFQKHLMILFICKCWYLCDMKNNRKDALQILYHKNQLMRDRSQEFSDSMRDLRRRSYPAGDVFKKAIFFICLFFFCLFLISLFFQIFNQCSLTHLQLNEFASKLKGWTTEFACADNLQFIFQNKQNQRGEKRTEIRSSLKRNKRVKTNILNKLELLH